MREKVEAKHAHDDDDDDKDVGYFNLDRLVRYSGLSRSTLRRYLHDAEHPLPHHEVRIAGKTRGRVLVRKTEFDAWMRAFNPTSRAEPTPDPITDTRWIRRAFGK